MPAPDRRRQLLPWALVATSLTAAAWGWLRPTPASAPATRVTIALPAAQALQPGDQGVVVALAPDGRSLAYVGRGPQLGTDQVWVRRLDALEAMPVEGSEAAAGVHWSPDGKTLLVVRVNGGTVALAADGTGRPIPLASTASAVVGPDGLVYGVTNSGRVVLRQTIGGKADTIYRSPQEWGVGHVVPYRDGRNLLLVRVLVDATTAAEIVSVSLADGTVTPVTTGEFVRLLANGDLLWVTGDGNVFVAPFDVASGRLRGAPVAVTQVAMGSYNGRGYPQVTVADDGTMVYLSGTLTRQRVVWLSPEGRRVGAVGVEGNIWGLALFPDDRRLAYALREDARASVAAMRDLATVWVSDLATGARTRLTDSLFNGRPSWSRDGQRVLFARVSPRSGTQGLVARAAGGATPEVSVLTLAQFGHSVGDGRWIGDGPATRPRPRPRPTVRCSRSSRTSRASLSSMCSACSPAANGCSCRAAVRPPAAGRATAVRCTTGTRAAPCRLPALPRVLRSR